MPRVTDFAPSVSRPEPFLGAADERLYDFHLGLVNVRQLGQFDDPLAAEIIRRILGAHLRQGVTEPLITRQNAQGGRFPGPLSAFQDQDAVCLASGLHGPGDGCYDPLAADLVDVSRVIVVDDVDAEHGLGPSVEVF